MSTVKKTRVFIIARFKDGVLFETLRDELKKHDIEVTHDWYTPMKNRERHRQTDGRAKALVADIAGILKAEYVISLMPRGNDSYVEIGAAIMADKPIILVSEQGFSDFGYSEHPLVIARPPLPDTAMTLACVIDDIITGHKGRNS